MRKIILAAINAKYIHSNLAVYNLKAYAGFSDEEIVLREYTINQQTDEILKDLYRQKGDVICFSAYIWNIEYVLRLAEDIKSLCPHIHLWAGGPEVSYDAEDFLKKHTAFTGVMVGEGEETFKELSEYYLLSPDPDRPGKNMEDISGLVFRAREGIYRTSPRPLMDMDLIPFVYDRPENFQHKIIYYESSRGCPFSCSYCLSSIDKKVRFRSLDLVLGELQFFIDHGIPQVKFVDRTFNCNHSHAMAIWDYIARHDNGVTNFHFEISADLLNEEELKLMKSMRPGLIQLEIGVQSTNPATIKAIRRTMDLDRLRENVLKVYDFANIHQHLDLIAGLPYEDMDSFRTSFNEVFALKPHQLQLGFLKVLKGSHMMEKAQSYGILWHRNPPYEVMETEWISYRDILKLKNIENMVEIYYNSFQFTETLSWLLGFWQDAFSFFLDLGQYYESMAYDSISHSRIRRYEILLEYADKHLKDRKDYSAPLLAEYMVYDLYLRENLKSRPSFAPDQKPHAAAIWAYRKANNVPKDAHFEVVSDGSLVWFDYTCRDPLTHNAKVRRIPPDAWNQDL